MEPDGTDRRRRVRYLEEIAKTTQTRTGVELGSAPTAKPSQTVDYSGVSVRIVTNDGEVLRRGLIKGNHDKIIGIIAAFFDGKADMGLHEAVAPIGSGMSGRFTFVTEHGNFDLHNGTGVPTPHPSSYTHPGHYYVSGFGYLSSGVFDGFVFNKGGSHAWAPVVIAHGKYNETYFVGISAQAGRGGVRPAALVLSAIMPKDVHDATVANNCEKLEEMLGSTLPKAWMDFLKATQVRYTPDERSKLTYIGKKTFPTASDMPYYVDNPRNVFTAPRIIVKAIQK